MTATRMMGSTQTACMRAYQGGQTPGIRSTAMIAIGMMTARALTRSKARRDPRAAAAIIRTSTTATTGNRAARTHMNVLTV
ncbi:hypothetical protein [Dactylosporangium darangshiense]|uniref:hypothetical protein n=1 Tax=Dactylosporangium darangshiense TaxID=579108 RepID=UPI0036424322